MPRIRRFPMLCAATAVAVTAATAALLSLSAQAATSAAEATTTVEVQPAGGYITTYTATNGDVTKVYAPTPVTVTLDAETSQQMTVDGATVTEHSGGMTIMPVATLDKSTPTLAGAISPYDELLALGVSPAEAASFDTAAANSGGGKQIGSICVNRKFDGTHGHVHGCDVTRRVGTSGAVWYLTDSAESSGSMHDTGCTFCDHITGLKFGVRYRAGNVIQHWKPASSYDVGNCVTNTVSLSFKGVGVSSSAVQCPQTFGLYGVGNPYFSTKWDGKGHGPNDGARATHAVDAVVNGASASPLPGVFYHYWYTTT